MNQRTLRPGHFGLAGLVATALSLMIAGTSYGQCADMLGEEISFVVAADLNGDGVDEIIVGLSALSEHHVAEFAVPGDVLVYERVAPGTVGNELHRVFRCRSNIPETYLPGFFQPTLVSVADLDSDSLPEVVIVWYEQYWWPTAYQPLSILQFDPAEGTYELLIDNARYVGEIGGYAVEDVDDDGIPEIVEIDPVYGTENNPVTGIEELECHYCPHQYGVQVLEFDGQNFHTDPGFNSGGVYVTPDKYLPEVAWEAISDFLPEILEQIRSIVRESSTESDD